VANTNYGAFIQGDPVYAQARLGAKRDLNTSLGTAFQRQQEFLMQLGDPSIARSIFQNNSLARRAFGDKMRTGHLGGKIRQQIVPEELNSLKAIRAAGDPATGTSTLAKLAYAYNENVRQANESENAQGLFYSGHRGKILGYLAHEKQLSQAEAIFGARQQLNSVLDFIMQQRRQYRTTLQSAAEAAYNRQLAQQIAGG
jgi:hypothetical protein